MTQINSFLESVKTELDRTSLKYSEWFVKNYKNPRNERLPWSFKDHEFQIDIVDEPAREMSVQKCAQVGLSVLLVRYVLAFCRVNDYRKGAYVLPTSRFAIEFATTRIDPAIDSCDIISSVVSKDVDNSSTKKIGTCFLLMRGTSGTVAAISQDLDIIVTDEKDFCNQNVLGSFASRLQHSDLKLVRNFSTPTVPEYGISAEYIDSSQGVRMVKHSRCGRWVVLDPFTSIVIPGFDMKMEEFRKGMHTHPGIPKAYYACPHCKKPVSAKDLNDPDRREWVHKFPDAVRRGYLVRPWDVPVYNELPEILASIKNYKLHSDWVNFRLGETYADSESSFMTMESNYLPGSGWTLESVLHSGVYHVYVGGDLGKTAHILIGIATNDGLRIISMGRPDVRKLPENNLGKYLKNILSRLWAQRTVVDAAPNYETALYLHQNMPTKTAYGAYFGGLNKTTLDIYQFNDDRGIVNIERDAAFDATSKAWNTGEIRVLNMPAEELEIFKKHLAALKKTKQMTSKGEVLTWVSTGEDHYALALLYLYTAYASVSQRHLFSGVSVLPSFHKVKMKV